MQNNFLGRRKAGGRLWPATFLGSGGAAGLWLGLAEGGVQMLLASAVLAVMAVLGTVWLARDRAARRLNAVWEVYAERELARAGTRGQAPGGQPVIGPTVT